MKAAVYDPARHRGFVFPTWSAQAGLPGRVLDDMLARGARLVVAESDDGQDALGWGGALGDKLIWLYAKRDLARMVTKTPHQGRIDKVVVAALALPTAPLVALFPGHPLEVAARKCGWTLVYDQPGAAA